MQIELTDHADLEAFIATGPIERRATSRSFASRLENIAIGRFALSCIRWSIVIVLVVSGYMGAGAVNAGIKLAQQAQPAGGSGSQILASSSSHK